MRKTITLIALMICCLSLGAYAQGVKTADDEAEDVNPRSSHPDNAPLALVENTPKSEKPIGYTGIPDFIGDRFDKMNFFYPETKGIGPLQGKPLKKAIWNLPYLVPGFFYYGTLGTDVNIRKWQTPN